MNKYVMLQEPKQKEYDTAPQILIIDNSTATGKAKVEKLVNQGYRFAGTIETELSESSVRSGICRDRIDRLEAYQSRMREAMNIIGNTLETV
ncbi:MAG: hypothetical protein LUE87_06355 [Lachnospiraceae bacterium]|nr:hypothetical protein [Lachnospiraceae bacterium]